MKYTITLRDTITGFQRDYPDRYDYQDTPGRADEKVKYQWLEGNYSCDCNRADFLWDYRNKKFVCNHAQKNRVELLKIVDKTGRVVWEVS